MKMRFGLAVLAAIGLSACAETDVVLNHSYVTDFGSYQDSDYTAEHADATGEKAANANWANAHKVTLSLRQNEFSPMIVHLKKGEPYSITVKNNDNNVVSFRADEFFANSSVAQLSEAKHEDDMLPAAEKPLLVSFVVPPMGERTVNLIPVMEGRYEYEDASPGLYFVQWGVAPFSRAATLGTAGVFIVE